MPITNRDYLVKLTTSYGVPCLNTFWYRTATPFVTGRAAQLAAAFNSQVVTAIAGALNTIVNIGDIAVENLVELSDYHTQNPTAVQGAITATSPAPTFTAYNFQLQRSTRAGRHGYKRFPGVAEELVNFGTETVSGALVTAIPALITALGGSISSSGVDFQPMIPKRLKTLMPDGKYRWILTDLLPVGAVIFRGLTTQNTRKG